MFFVFLELLILTDKIYLIRICLNAPIKIIQFLMRKNLYIFTMKTFDVLVVLSFIVKNR